VTGQPLAGVKVVEVGMWMFAPTATAILADLGAEVVKVEHPAGGDPGRGLQHALSGTDGPAVFVEIPNHGKRSIGLDLTRPEALEALARLVAEADVFVTSLLPKARRALGVDVDDIRAMNPSIVYARASGAGPSGPEAERGGFDLASAWARGGVAHRLTPPGGEPPMMPPSFFDLQAAVALAGAIGMALFVRERTGEAPVVDTALLNVGMWALGPDVALAPYGGAQGVLRDRHRPGNPTTNWYRTADDRWLYLVHLQSDRHWPELCERIGHPELVSDPRFVDHASRSAHQAACVAVLDEIFASATLEEWRERLAGSGGVWAAVQSPAELSDDPQVVANGYLRVLESRTGPPSALVAPPFQFDGVPTGPAVAAPEPGEDTEAVLLELGFSWEEIARGKELGAFQ